jgi:hypothetical protein
MLKGLSPARPERAYFDQDDAFGETKIEENQMTVWIYVNTNVAVGDVDHLMVFANPDLADERFKENDSEAVALRIRSAGIPGTVAALASGQLVQMDRLPSARRWTTRPDAIATL